MKNILKYLGLLIIGLLVALFLLPFAYKGEIIEKLKQEVNNEIDGSIDFDNISISFFNSFPDVSVSLSDFELKSQKTESFTDVIKAEHLSVDLDLMTFLKRSEKQIINNVELSDATINLFTDKNGQSNYDVTKERNSANTSYLVALESYALKNSDLNYIDHQNETVITLENVNHKGSGNFTEEIFDLDHETTVTNADLKVADIKYISNLPIEADMVTKIDQSKKTYQIETKALSISNLQLNADGQVKLKDESVEIDLDIKGVNEKLVDLLSIIPGAFKSNIQDLAVDGYGSFKGSINGTYNSLSNSKPAIAFQLQSKDGKIRSKSTNDQIEDLNSEILISANNPDWSDLMVQIPSFTSTVDGQSLSGKFLTKDLMTDPLYDGDIKGLIDLGKIQNILSIETVDKMSGILDLDLQFYGKQSDIINENYSALKLDNKSKSDGINIDFKSLPSLELNKLDFDADKEALLINELNGKMGNSDFNVKGEINNPLVFLTDEGTTNGNVSIKSNSIDLNEFMQTEESSSLVQQIPDDKVDLQFDLDVGTLKYEDYDIKQVKANGTARVNSLELKQFTSKVNGSDIQAKGEFNNTYAYAMNQDTLYGKLVASSPKFDVDQFLGTSTSTGTSTTTRIPKNVSLLLDLNSDAVKYEKYNLKKFTSEVLLSEGRAIFSDSKARAFDGNITMDGMYDTTLDDPALSFSYDIDNFSFKSFYNGSEMFKKLAPVAEYIDGHFNSNMSMNATLKDGFEVDFSTLSADGFLETIHGTLKDFKPVEEMAEKLGISSLSKIAIDKSKNWFTIKDGAVILKDHDYDVESVKMTVGGSHKLNQEIDYLAKVKIPRALFKDNNGVVDIIDSGLDKLSKEATNLGVDIFNGDYIYADVSITGSVLNPKIAVRPTGSGGESLTEKAKTEITDRAREIKDEYVEKGKDKTEAVKDTVTQIVTTKIDTLESQAEEIVNEKVDEAIDKISDVITSKVDSTVSTVIKDTLATEIAKQVEDILKDKTKETDKIKDKLKDFKIFKKKGN